LLQVLLIQGLQERVAELEEALNREQDRCKLLQSDLARLRLQHQWSKAGGSSGGSTPTKGLSPCRLGSMDVATMPEAGPSPFAAAQRSQGAPARAGSLGNSNSTGIGGGAPPAAAADAQAAATQPAGPEGGKASAPMAVPAAGGSGSGSGSGCGHMALCSDTVSVSRHALELLYLKERAMDAAKEGIVIADCSQPDMPLIYANEGFTRMTGYSRADVLGRNCRHALLVAAWLPCLL
jgi:PAS domain-containing protein